MNFRFNISRKIGLGFGLFMLVVTGVFLITNETLRTSKEINRRINEEFAPSLKALQDLDSKLVRAQGLIHYWAFVQRREDDKDKLELGELCEKSIPEQLYRIRNYSAYWKEEDKMALDGMEQKIKMLLSDYSSVQSLLPTFESYTDPIASMMVGDFFLEGTHIPQAFGSIRAQLSIMIGHQQQLMTAEIERMNNSFTKLRVMLVNIAVGVLIAGLLIAFFTTQSIVKPIASLKRKLTNLSLGIYSVHPTKTGNDEIGDMALAVDRLIANFDRTKEFSMHLGSGDFNVEFTPLSEHDELGKSLLRMKDDLAAYRNRMEELVSEQTLEITKQKEEAEKQSEQMSMLYVDLQASIDYAQRLQETILPDDRHIAQMFPDSFVFFRPKATVSGDFYWFKELGGKKIFAAADCTGHGVPGAFMSLVGHNALNQVTRVFTQPAQILNSANRVAAEALRMQDKDTYIRDGMDIALCTFDPKTLKLEFSGAHNPAYIIRNEELIEIESDPFSIGTYSKGEKEFTNHTFQLEEGDCLYLFSDGYADQFGGPKGKKFMRKQFRMTLLRIHKLPMHDQKYRLAETLDQWRGDNEQVDDILVLGVRIQKSNPQ
jgi:serine phosphatase RsbU (regulator of sigma subunit)/HAMP domain-containing protein